jgi:hypothetical protein
MLNYIYDEIGWGLNSDHAKRNYADLKCET